MVYSVYCSIVGLMHQTVLKSHKDLFMYCIVLSSTMNMLQTFIQDIYIVQGFNIAVILVFSFCF